MLHDKHTHSRIGERVCFVCLFVWKEIIIIEKEELNDCNITMKYKCHIKDKKMK